MSAEALPMLVVLGIFGFYALLKGTLRLIGTAIRKRRTAPIERTKE